MASNTILAKLIKISEAPIKIKGLLKSVKKFSKFAIDQEFPKLAGFSANERQEKKQKSHGKNY